MRRRAAPARGTRIPHQYGLVEVDGYSHPWRMEFYIPFPRVAHQFDTRGVAERAMADGPDDTTPRHSTYPTGYDARCSCCYLGITHTEARHRAAIGRTTSSAASVAM